MSQANIASFELVATNDNELEAGVKQAEPAPLPLKRSFLENYVDFIDAHVRVLAVLILLATVGVGIYGIGVFSTLSSGGFEPPKSETAITDHYFSSQFVTPSPDIQILLSHPTWTVDDQQYVDSFYELKSNLESSIPVYGILSYFDYPFTTGLVSSDRRMTLATCRLPNNIVQYKGSPIVTRTDFERAAEGNNLTVQFTGGMLISIEFDIVVNQDLGNIEQGAAPVLIALLVIAFDGIIAVLPTLFLLIWSLVSSFACLRLVALGFRVTTFVTNVTTIFGAGLAIDFTLFLHLRYSEEMKHHCGDGGYDVKSAKKSIVQMLRTSGKTVFFSTLLLVTTLSGALQFSEFYLTTMALSVMFPAFLACTGSFLILPVMYLLLGKNIFYLRVSSLVEQFSSKSHPSGVIASVSPTSEPMKMASSVDQPEKSAPQSNLSFTAIDSSILPEHQIDLEANNVAIVAVVPQPVNNPSPSVHPIEDALVAVDSKAGPSVLLGDNLEDVKAETHTQEEKKVVTSSSSSSSHDSIHAIHQDKNGIWFRLVSMVVRYPVSFAALLLAGLVALMVIFFTQTNFGYGSYSYLPLGSPNRKTIEDIMNNFPSQGKSSMDVFIQTIPSLSVRNASFLEALDSYSAALEDMPFVASVTDMVRVKSEFNITDYIENYATPNSPDHINFTSLIYDPYYLTDFDRIARVSISISLSPTDSGISHAILSVRRLTHEVLSPYCSELGVTGDGPAYYDLNQDVLGTLPKFLAVVLVFMFVLVLLLTGSIVLPLKTIATSFLSLSASYGLMTLVFQENNGASFLRFRNDSHCLDTLQMIFIFVVSFGLSLDYEIFMLGRIQEIYSVTKDNNYAIAQGIQSSARSVTMAAILLCTAIGGFLASELLLLKEIGMGIGLTVVIDATVVRCILVPSVMSLMGDLNWWAPKPLQDFIFTLGLRH